MTDSRIKSQNNNDNHAHDFLYAPSRISSQITRVKILACGGHLPEKCLTNAELAEKVDTSDEWIKSRTGITQRFIVADGEATSDLATQAALSALNSPDFGQKVTHVDGIIVATTTPDKTFPSTACLVQKKLYATGISSDFAFDVAAVCAGFVYGFSMANAMISTGMAKTILVIGADALSKILDWTNRDTCVLFGDGAGAVLLGMAADEESSSVIATQIHSDGRLSDILTTTGGVSTTQNAGFITMQGREVFRHAVSKMSSSITNMLDENNIPVAEVRHIIAHQANGRILDAVAESLGLPPEIFVKTVDIHANTSAASIPLAMWEVQKKQRIRRGDLVVLEALGAGLTWGGVLLRY